MTTASVNFQTTRKPTASEISRHRPARTSLLQRKCACGDTPGLTGECEECARKKRLGLRTKLKVSEPGDFYEQQADRVADAVMRMPDEGVRRQNGQVNQTKPLSVQRMSDEDEEDLQRKPNGNKTIDPHVESQVGTMGAGQPLSKSEAAFFEPRFNRSFTDVRIHTGPCADTIANSINARAFTLGNHIAFASGEYSPGSAESRRLIAHELTHTMQQAGGAGIVQRGSAGILGGKCCNPAARVEWALVGNGVWKKLDQGQCTGTTEDCDGMTCGGGFYYVDNLQKGSCVTPRTDDATFAPRRWTPNLGGANAHSPTAEGSTQGDAPPNYVYDSAATAQCPTGVRTISVDFVRLHGATQSPAGQLAVANTAYKGCCVQFVAGATPPPESEADTKGWLGGDTDLAWDTKCGSISAEERAMFDAVTTRSRLSSRMRVFFVATMTPATALANSLPSYCATGAAAPYLDYVEINNSALPDTLAHEFGHILLNSGNHAGIVNPADTRNLMFAPGRTASDLDATQCATIYGNA